MSCQHFLKNTAEVGEIKQLWLSGIFSGDGSAPIDMLLVGKIKKDKFIKRLQNLEADLNKEINYTLMDEAEYEYRLEIHDIFLNRIRQSRHLKIINSEKENN